MCGRYNYVATGDDSQLEFELPTVPTLTPRYNVAPTDMVAVVASKADRSTRGLGFIRWGMVPYWANDPKGKPLVNVRAETVSWKFREQLNEKRCLIPATGFYEWVTVGRTKKGRNIVLPDRPVFAFAGLWDVWEGDGKKLASTAIVTTAPNELVSQVHDRMPVILRRDDYAEWFDPETAEKRLLQLLAQYPASLMSMYAVGPAVNSTKNKGPECIEPERIEAA